MQLEALRRREPQLSIRRLAEIIQKYEGITLSEFPNMSPERKEALEKILLKHDVESKKVHERLSEEELCDYKSILERLYSYDLHEFESCAEMYLNKYCNIDRYNIHINQITALRSLLSGYISTENVYSFLIQEYSTPNVIKGEDVRGFLSRIFINDKFLLFTVACNLYAYILKEHLEDYKEIAKSFLSFIDGKNIFGRYAHDTNEIHNHLLPYTQMFIPEIRIWISTLEYCHDLHPCLPADLELWKKEGERNMYKKIFLAMKRFVDTFPDSVFLRNAECIMNDAKEELKSYNIAKFY